jgi:hypothetical protein
VTSATDPIVSNDGTIFTATNNSQQWTISDVVVECDTITLDSALQNSYIQHVMSNHALEISYGTYINMIQTVSGPTFWLILLAILD